ncbi:MAG: hypothetical protein WBB85_14520, partial [Albidovulum sp.]|uniref:hypothetical protein n=1 Tax=Albidovulum sp. TaxID=1872424 RepID=UPI003CBDFB42
EGSRCAVPPWNPDQTPKDDFGWLVLGLTKSVLCYSPAIRLHGIGKMIRISLIFSVWTWLVLPSTAHAQDATYDMMLNYSLMEQSRCNGGGGNWTGMTCSGSSGGSGGLTEEDLEALQETIGAWHQREMRKATCLMIVAATRTLEDLGQRMRQHVAEFRPPELHIFQENPRSFLLTHGYTRMLIGHSLDQRIRRGEVPRNSMCWNIDYAEKHYKVVASGARTGASGYDWTGDMDVISALQGR